MEEKNKWPERSHDLNRADRFGLQEAAWKVKMQRSSGGATRPVSCVKNCDKGGGDEYYNRRPGKYTPQVNIVGVSKIIRRFHVCAKCKENQKWGAKWGLLGIVG